MTMWGLRVLEIYQAFRYGYKSVKNTYMHRYMICILLALVTKTFCATLRDDIISALTTPAVHYTTWGVYTYSKYYYVNILWMYIGKCMYVCMHTYLDDDGFELVIWEVLYNYEHPPQ